MELYQQIFLDGDGVYLEIDTGHEDLAGREYVIQVCGYYPPNWERVAKEKNWPKQYHNGKRTGNMIGMVVRKTGKLKSAERAKEILGEVWKAWMTAFSGSMVKATIIDRNSQGIPMRPVFEANNLEGFEGTYEWMKKHNKLNLLLSGGRTKEQG